jgi:2-dehydropantoate 2-reductase
MRITVWGAGAIGGITGGALVRAGRDVLLVDVDAAHVQAMNTDGLRVEDAQGDWQVAVRAATPDEVMGKLGLVLLAVKAQATGAALGQIVPHLTAQSVVVPLQNGLNEKLIASHVGAKRTLGCLVNWAGDWLAPGRIQFGGQGSFMVGELDGSMTPRLRDLAGMLSVVMPVERTSNIWGCLWSKTCYASLLFASALTDETVYDVVERSPDVQRTLVLLVAEAMAVAEAAGVKLVSMIHQLEDGRRRMGWENLQELAALTR